MKPVKLIISAIGPYAGRIPDIEFVTFEEKGVFDIRRHRCGEDYDI